MPAQLLALLLVTAVTAVTAALLLLLLQVRFVGPSTATHTFNGPHTTLTCSINLPDHVESCLTAADSLLQLAVDSLLTAC